MEDQGPSRMAYEIAGARASEMRRPEEARVCTDHLADLFMTPEAVKSLDNPQEWKAHLDFLEQILPGVNGAIVARVRFFDEFLAEQLDQGLEQLVLLGAGYDTRAYRFGKIQENVKVFELDHVATQRVKKEKIQEHLGQLPEYISYVTLDFDREKLADKLTGGRYDPHKKTLFICEGLMMYLPQEVVKESLEFIAKNSGPGSRVLFDFFEQSVIEGKNELPEARTLFKFVSDAGTPLRFGVKDGDVEKYLTERGFKDVQTVTTDYCKSVYFEGASQSRTVSSMFRFVHAGVDR